MGDTLPPLARHMADIVRQVIAEIRPHLVDAALSGNRGEETNLRHADNFLSTHDMWMHNRYRELITAILSSFVYASEEDEPRIVGDDPDPDLCVLVDPLDTSELAVRGLHGYTHLLVYSRSLARPVCAVVGDIFHHIQLYAAARDETGQDHAWVHTADGTAYPLEAHAPVTLPEALVTMYLMRPAERFGPLAQQTRLLDTLGKPGADGKSRGRIGVDFGSVGLCHVAAGFTDAMIEFAKGFAIWDLLPGHYILAAAGGTVLDLDGKPLGLDYRLDSLDHIAQAMNPRQTFIATRTPDLAHRILATLNTHTQIRSGQ